MHISIHEINKTRHFSSYICQKNQNIFHFVNTFQGRVCCHPALKRGIWTC